MKKLRITAMLLCTVAISAHAQTIQVSVQTTKTDKMRVEQRNGKNNKTTINRYHSKKSLSGVKQKIEGKKLTIIQKNAKNSKFIGNDAQLGGGAGAWQDVNVKKIKIKQQGGRGNEVILNNVDHN
ncbi:MAG: hypothetical protein CR974_03545 [Gammaproteobacteria bacterium]|nr:MAG: hypothetical protein CR974_03545 [Gammaproteobacteria bacterium]